MKTRTSKKPLGPRLKQLKLKSLSFIGTRTNTERLPESPAIKNKEKIPRNTVTKPRLSTSTLQSITGKPGENKSKKRGSIHTDVGNTQKTKSAR